MRYKIADFNFRFSNTHAWMMSYGKAYECNQDSDYDVHFTVTDQDVHNEIIFAEEDVNDFYLEAAAYSRKISEWLPLNNAILFHSASFDIKGVGIAFAAHSGTGKTTHMRLWQEYLGDKMVVVNGDKPIVRFFDDEPETPYAYGTPWNGKEHLGCNMRTPLKHICFIERSETNYVEPMEKADAISRMFNQVYKPTDPMAVMKTMQLIDRLLSCCKLWVIHCNMEPEAAEIAYKTIFESNT